MASPPRARTKRREHERALRKGVRRLETLADRLPGGSPEHPFEVTSASVIDNRARSTPCVQCNGTLDLRTDRATPTAYGLLREVSLICRQCHAPRTLWFRVTVAAPS